MTASYFRSYIRSILAEADETNKTKTKIKQATATDKAVEDLLDDLPDTNLPQVIDVGDEPAADNKPPRAQPTRGGVSLSDFDNMDIDSILDRMGDDDFDFDAEFEKDLQKDPVKFGQNADGIDDTPDEDLTPRFQPNQPYYQGQPGVVGQDQLTREDVKTRVLKVLMDEFVAPAMSVGMNVLPHVWQELSRLKRSQPRAFYTGFQIALNQIRDIENSWFANLLSFDDYPQASVQVPAEQREIVDRVRSVLEMYYTAVLEAAGQNAGNMTEALSEIQARATEDDYRQGFFDALSATRDIEDQAFLQFMGGPHRLMQQEIRYQNFDSSYHALLETYVKYTRTRSRKRLLSS